MIITIWNRKTHHALKFAVFVVLFYVMDLGVGGAKGDDMKSIDFRVSIGAQPITFTAPPILKDGMWLVPLEHFAEQLGLKVEYTGRREDSSSLRRHKIRTLCTTSVSG